MKPFERLEAWRLCHQLALAIYAATASFPREEMYGLSAQLRRAAYSAAANIAEGVSKRGPREFRRYLDVSLGSLSEIAYGLLLAADLKILPRPAFEELETLRNRAGMMTWKLYRSMNG